MKGLAVLARGRKTPPPGVTWTLTKSPEPSPQLPRSIGRAQQNHQKRKKWTTESGGGGLGERQWVAGAGAGGGRGVQAEAAAWSLLPSSCQQLGSPGFFQGAGKRSYRASDCQHRLEVSALLQQDPACLFSPFNAQGNKRLAQHAPMVPCSSVLNRIEK